MKKILIVVMSCESEFFEEQVKTIKETWAKDILDKKYPNIDFIYYKGTLNTHSFNKETRLLNVQCEDDLNNTYKKTYYALNLINKSFEYDYIFRTNTSTYVNVELLNAFVQSLDNDEIFWTSEIYSLIEANCPTPLCLYGRGNGILFSKKLVEIFLKEGINLLYMEQVDDVMIGNVLNSYWIKQGKDHRDYIRSYMHGWYRSVNTTLNNNGNTLCQWNNKNLDFDFIGQFITVQVKTYELPRLNSREIENVNHVHDVIKSNEYKNIDEYVQRNHKYSNNPFIFIGSILGYISYNKYKSISSQSLYALQSKYKASDDPFREKFKNKPWL